jgi:hypothetical protein
MSNTSRFCFDNLPNQLSNLKRELKIEIIHKFFSTGAIFNTLLTTIIYNIYYMNNKKNKTKKKLKKSIIIPKGIDQSDNKIIIENVVKFIK